jgi:hypothetical protein
MLVPGPIRTSVSWRAIHSAVGCAVTPTHKTRRRSWVRISKHREAEAKLLAPPTDPPQQSHQRGCGETSSSPETVVASCGHILGHTGVPDVDAELEKFAMRPRCVPERVGRAHRTDQAAHFQRHRRPAPAHSRFPTPIGSKPARCQRITLSGWTSAVRRER